MSSIHEKTLACLFTRIFANPAIVRLLDDDALAKDILRECGLIMMDKTEKNTVVSKAETAQKYQKYPTKAFAEKKEYKEVKTIAFRDPATGSLLALYYVSGDNAEFLQPVYEKGYKQTGKTWIPTEEDANHLIGWIPFGCQCDYDRIEIKSQWLSKTLKNAGTDKGIEARYNPALASVADILPTFIPCGLVKKDEVDNDEVDNDEVDNDEVEVDEVDKEVKRMKRMAFLTRVES